MINITFPDGSNKEYSKGITGYELANLISKSLAKTAIAIKLNGDLKNLSEPINYDSTIQILKATDSEALEIIRHSAAHILAEATQELFPDVNITIGPTITDGFYYDFAKDTPFSSVDLENIENKMREIVKRNAKFERQEWNRNDAMDLFAKKKENYKVDIISSIPEGETITLFKQGSFIDLCKGPHCPSTGHVKYFKLTKVAGAYWRGDSNNVMLQRIYGTAWSTQKELDDYLHRISEAEKRDHRKLGKELDLFHFQEEAQGIPFWHDKGWTIYRLIETYIRNKIKKYDYKEVKTPMMVDKSLWEKSGHWEKFRDNMFSITADDKTYALKPMNCPCHVEIFKQGVKSYRDLPYRIAEFGSCHRNESSGGLHGLLRVRNFVQDDAHIFCTEDQIDSETIAFCNLLLQIYKDFGFTKVKVKFSDRPDIRAGEDEIWDKAEQALKEAVDKTNLEYEINSGEGAFYGPKLEFVLTDAIGREWQCGTLQVDFVLPQRLGAKYIAQDGEKHNTVMIHRAIIGAFERFIGVLIEEYAGKFPLWLTPIQVGIVGITNDLDSYVKSINATLIEAGVRSTLDISKEKVNYKIRSFSHQKVPIIAVVGKKELEDKTLTLRMLDSNKHQTVTIEKLIDIVHSENKKYGI